MKIKYNIPMLNNIKILKEKMINKKQESIKKELKYYVLLVLMLITGIATFSVNVKKYNDINSEQYVKYELDNKIETNNDKVVPIIYETAISSISTNVSNMEQDTSETSKTEQNNIYIWPVKGEIIKEFSTDNLTYSKTLDMWEIHTGIDIKADIGTEVLAVNEGKIIEVMLDEFYGKAIKIEHKDGYVSIYKNLNEIICKKDGEYVKQGDIIGYVGNTAKGEILEENHLHFEILKNSDDINPLEVLE